MTGQWTFGLNHFPTLIHILQWDNLIFDLTTCWFGHKSLFQEQTQCALVVFFKIAVGPWTWNLNWNTFTRRVHFSWGIHWYIDYLRVMYQSLCTCMGNHYHGFIVLIILFLFLEIVKQNNLKCEYFIYWKDSIIHVYVCRVFCAASGSLKYYWQLYLLDFVYSVLHEMCFSWQKSLGNSSIHLFY